MKNIDKLFFKSCLLIVIVICNTFLMSGQCSVTLSSKNDSCFGDCNGSAFVTATTGKTPYSYIWLGGQSTMIGPTVNNLCAGTYTVSLHDGVGCTSTTSITITQPSRLNVITASTPSHPGQNGGTASADVTGGTPVYKYSWTPGGATSQTATGLNPGDYTVSVTDSKGCNLTSTVTVGILDGINELNSTVNFALYPNPAKNNLNIEFPPNSNNSQVLCFYDLLGNVLYQTRFTENHYSLDVSSYPAGIYFVELRDEQNGNIGRKKVLLQ